MSNLIKAIWETKRIARELERLQIEPNNGYSNMQNTYRAAFGEDNDKEVRAEIKLPESEENE